jgi:lactate dehydrogenase-like 2-hydroxyacid dehydrogenase
MAARSGSAEQFTDANKNLAALTRNPNGYSLGIIGYGRIGRRVAEKAHAALNMKIIYNDVVEIPSSVPATFYKDMNALLAEADCVLIATPFSGDTLINADSLARMKKGARLINIARGKLVDEPALVEALKSGHLYSAGLDVHFHEPNVSKELIKMKNVELLSHNAGASLDSHIGFEKLGMDNIVSFLDTGKAVSPVNSHLIKQSRL